MQRQNAVRWGASLIVFSLTGCGAGEPADDDAPTEHVLTRFDTLIAPATGRIGVVSDLWLAGDGRLWVADRVDHRVVALDADGRELLSLGGEGEGPGELRRPEALAVSDSGVVVLDFGNRRLQHLAFDGRPVGQTPLALQPFVPADVGARGDLALPTIGLGESLVAVLRPGRSEPVRLGEPLAEPPQVISRSRLRDQVRRGEIPVEFRNNVLPVLGPGGELWVVLQGEGTLQHYAPDGRLLWSRALEDPEVAAARTAFFAAWEAEERAGAVHVPWTATTGTLVGGELWLRLGPGEAGRSVIAVLDAATGRQVRRLVLTLGSPAGAFAVDAERGVLYVALPDEAALVRGELPW